MSKVVHPAAPHHLPPFITAPGETDLLLNAVVVILVVTILLVGVLYFRLHALPEQIAHRSDKVQYQVVAVLALLALFTHNHIYWIAGLLLALVQLPDFSTPLAGIAESLARIAGTKHRRPDIKSSPPPSPAPSHPRRPAGEVKDASHA